MDALLDHAPCGFLSFSDDGVIRLVNATLLEMLGYEDHELVGSSVERIFPIGTRIFYQTHFFPLIRLHGHAEEIFLLLRCRSGEDIGVLCNVLRREREGQVANDCVFVRVRERQKYEQELLQAKKVAEQARHEVEEQKVALEEANEQLEAQAVELELQHQQMREQAAELESTSEELRRSNESLRARGEELEHLRQVAEEANRAKSTFLAVMSHELRTPLNAIAGYVELLEMGIHGPVTEAQRNALTRIERSQRHLLRLINDVLNLARIEAGRVDYDVKAVSLAEALAGVTPMVEPQLADKELRFRTDVPEELVVLADPDKLPQVVLNLLSNAIKFTPAGGQVTLEAEADGTADDRVLVRVIDTGIGIPAEKLDSVFAPFVQVDVSRSGRAEGTGLGLAISRDLARGMGGDLRVESVEGQGSTFTLSLRRAPRA